MSETHKHITRIDPNKVQNRSSRSVSKQEPNKSSTTPSRDD